MDEGAKRTTAQAFFRAQDGLITSGQAREAGFSASAVGRRLADGEWVLAAPRVYRIGATPETTRSRARAAAMSVRDAVLVGATAAWWWRLTDRTPDPIELGVPPHRRPDPRAGVRYSHRGIPDDLVVTLDGVRVTKRAPTLLDAIAEIDLVGGAKLLDRALLSGRVSLDELRDAHADRTPRRGSPRVRTLLALAAGGARSEAERVAVREVRAEKITGWVANLEVRLPRYGPAVLDLAFPELRVVVEIDGWAYHRGAREFLRDARRQNALAAAGWIVLRTNWFELREDPAAFIGALRAAVAESSRRLKDRAR